MIVYGGTRGKHGTALSSSERLLLSQTRAASRTAGCGDVQTIGGYAGGLDQAHIGSQIATPPSLATYPSTPPASGPHDPTPLAAGVYTDPPSIYSAIHSLEHGSVIIWYDSSASGSELNQIMSFFSDPTINDHIIVAPYSYPAEGSAGKLPAGKQMVLVAWHRLEACASPSLAAAFDFVVHYRYPPPGGESYRGAAPEKGAPI